jgi:hypothetical protein
MVLILSLITIWVVAKVPWKEIVTDIIADLTNSV